MTILPSQFEYAQVGRSTTSPKEILQHIKGTSCTIPDYNTLLEEYASDIHPDLDLLRKDINKYLETMIPSSTMVKKLIRADLTSLGAALAPYAPVDRVKTVVFGTAWSFVWDDQVDVGPFRENLALGDEFRERTLAYIRSSLGLAQPNDFVPVLTPATVDSDKVIKAFDPIGDAMRQDASVAQCQRLYDELEFWIQSTREEQLYYRNRVVPSAQQYLELRMATSGYGVSVALIEYFWCMELPEQVMNSHAIKQIIEATVIVMWMANDISSLKKELADDQFSMPSCLMVDSGISMQTALDRCMTLVKESLQQFNEGERYLESRYHEEPEVLSNIKKFIQGCEYQMTGKAQWCKSTARYGIPEAKNGNVTITF